MIISTDDTSKSLGIVCKVKIYAKEGAFLHRHGISFHLSHLPPLYILCHFCSIGIHNKIVILALTEIQCFEGEVHSSTLQQEGMH